MLFLHICHLLIMNFICHNKQDVMTALHYACKSGSAKLVKLLTDRGSDVMARDNVSNDVIVCIHVIHYLNDEVMCSCDT